jgi:hypothetical protein
MRSTRTARNAPQKEEARQTARSRFLLVCNGIDTSCHFQAAAELNPKVLKPPNRSTLERRSQFQKAHLLTYFWDHRTT